MEEDESMRALPTANHAAPAIQQQTRNGVAGTTAKCTSPTSPRSQFRITLLGGLRDERLERVMAETYPSSRATDAVPQSAQALRTFPR